MHVIDALLDSFSRLFRFHRYSPNNLNSKSLKGVEEIATAIALIHNLVRIGREEVIPT